MATASFYRAWSSPPNRPRPPGSGRGTTGRAFYRHGRSVPAQPTVQFDRFRLAPAAGRGGAGSVLRPEPVIRVARLARPTMCRVSDTGPLMIYPPVLMAGVRKPSGKEPAGAGLAVCYLWGFAGAASWVGAALAVVMGDGPTIGVGILSPRRPLAGCFWHDRGRRTRPGRPPVNSAAMPEARFPGRWVVR